jgi:osmotically inducible protein OsmC
MPTRKAQANWEGTLTEGTGTMKPGSFDYEGKFNAGSRFEDKPGTNPEELLGAAHAGCYSMSLSKTLDTAGHKPEKVDTTATVELEKAGDGYRIASINLKTKVKAEGLNDGDLKKFAETARDECLVSKALGSVNINVDYELMK